MTVAVLNDIHGNLNALRAVLEEPDVVAADVIVVGGDLIPGPEAPQVVELIRELGPRVRMLRGSGERTVCAADIHPDAGADSVESWVKRRLDVRDIDKLRALPLVMEIDGALLCHASPTDDAAPIGPDMSDSEIAESMLPVTRGTLIVGHSHTQFDRTVGDLRVVSTGSVGLPVEGSQGARWALVDGPQIYLRTTQYDVSGTIQAWESSGFPETQKWCQRLRS